MKVYSVLSIVIFSLLSFQLHASDFYTYNLYESKLQTAFPSNPNRSAVDTPPGMKVVSYSSQDPAGKFVVTSRSMLNLLDKNITKYNKSALDKQNKEIEKLSMLALQGVRNYTLIDFQSKIDKSNEEYVAIYTFSYLLEGHKIYKSVKHIITNEKEYKWGVSYDNVEYKKVFELYKDHIRTIK